jgi:hypothetical protein
MIPEVLPRLACETEFLVPKRCYNKDTEFLPKFEMPENTQLSERGCIGDPALHQGAFNSKSDIRLLFDDLACSKLFFL